MMRILSGLFVVAMVCSLALSGCGGVTSPSPQPKPPSPSTPAPPASPTPTPLPPSPSNGSITATIDGSRWSAAGFLAVQYQPNIVDFVIVGSDSTDTNTARIITLALPVYRTGTFVACLDSLSCAFLSMQISGRPWVVGLPGSSGTVVVSKMTAHNAVGTFSFVAVDQNGANKKYVTNGAFNVTY